jgi:glycosyltransferase involved in cell wall biosynthesis
VSLLPKTVLHVLNSASGGAALSTTGLIEGLRTHGIEACAVCQDEGAPQDRDRLRELCHGNVLFTPLYTWNRKIRLPAWKRPLSEIRQLLRTGWKRTSTHAVAAFAELHGIDLIHTNTILNPEGALAAIQLRLPHVWHCRELVGSGNPFPMAMEGAALGRYLASHSSVVVANSQVTAKPLREVLPKERLEVVPNGIDLSRFQYRLRALDDKQPIVIGMVGGLTAHWKKHWLLVAAAAQVDRTLPIEWRIYGNDPSQGGTLRGDAYCDALHEQIAAARLTDRFHWPGYVADPVEVMNQIDILVHPADGESFGRIVIEAMAAGIPVVGVAGGGVGEIIEHELTGLLSPVDDAAGLAANIERVVRDGALRGRLGEAGHTQAQQAYSLEAYVSGMLAVYSDAMQRPLGSASPDPATMVSSR